MRFFDKLFGSKEKKTINVEIYAPVTGELIHLEDVPDVVFSEKIVGDGIAIRPTGTTLVAPANGTINKIFETNHAFSMTTTDGIELFVHFGVDTVELKGKGFTRIAKENQQVKCGDPIIELDLDELQNIILEVQHNDASLIRYPRFKISDDSTVVKVIVR